MLSPRCFGRGRSRPRLWFAHLRKPIEPPEVMRLACFQSALINCSVDFSKVVISPYRTQTAIHVCTSIHTVQAQFREESYCGGSSANIRAAGQPPAKKQEPFENHFHPSTGRRGYNTAMSDDELKVLKQIRRDLSTLKTLAIFWTLIFLLALLASFLPLLSYLVKG